MATNPLFYQTAPKVPVGRRSRSRARVALPAVLETIEGLRHVKLRNLSSAGAMVETPRVPGVGKDLVLKCFGIDALGVVIWEDGDRCGIEFYDPIDEDQVVRQRALSDDEFAQHKWRTRKEMLEAAERWSLGKTG